MTKVFRHLMSRRDPFRRTEPSELDSSLAVDPSVPLPSGTIRALASPGNPMTVLLLNYSYLQVLDLLTTSAFLLAGIQEANPLVVLAMKIAPNAILGLAAVKTMALVLGLICWWTSRARLLKVATVFYAILVAYNLVCLILGLAVR